MSYSEYHYAHCLILSVTIKSILLNDVIVSVIILNVMAPNKGTCKGLVMYGKWADYVKLVFFYYFQSLSLAWTNTLAYYGICTLLICNALSYMPTNINFG